MSHLHDGYGLSSEDFLRLVEERVREKRAIVRAKLEADLRKIKLEVENEGRLYPMQIFPLEIWAHIFQMLSPEDLATVYQVHPVFQDYLRPNRIPNILLPLALNLPIFHNALYTNPDQLIRSRFLAPCEGVLVLREVCKSLRYAVDRYICEQTQQTEGQIYRNLEIRSDFGVYVNWLNQLTRKYSGLCQVTHFHKIILKKTLRVRLLHELPFAVEDPDPRVEGELLRQNLMGFINTITSLLTLVGDQILSFECMLETNGLMRLSRVLTVKEMYNTLALEWICKMPNLRRLKLRMRKVREDGNPDQNNNDNNDDGVEEANSPWVRAIPFPRLDHLKTLLVDFYYTSETYHVLLAILESNPQLKDVTIGASERLFLEKLPSSLLHSFDLNSFSVIATEEHELPEFQCVQRFLRPNWNMSTFKVSLDMGNFSLNQIFQFLETLPTLSILSLEFGNLNWDQDFGFLVLPNLTDLEIFYEVNRNLAWKKNALKFFFSLQFLIYSKNLKKLKWNDSQNFVRRIYAHVLLLRLHFVMLMYETRERSVIFADGMTNILESNIWEIFPHLEYVRVNRHEFLRKQRIVKE